MFGKKMSGLIFRYVCVERLEKITKTSEMIAGKPAEFQNVRFFNTSLER
jgi:hypothetical protein